jgi:hypothetical protein
MATIDMTTTTFTGALARIKDELLAIPIHKLRTINVDIAAAVVTIFGTLPMLRSLRPAIVAELGERHAAPIDRLELDAQAMGQAHAACLIAATSTAVQALSDEVVATREVLFADATAGVKRKLIAPSELAELRGNVGFRNQVLDLLQLIAIFRKHWAALEPRTGVKPADLDQAEQLAQRFVNALGEREQAQSSSTERTELSQRAFTNCVNTYDLVRRAVTFLRWAEGDADSIVPSLWAGRGGRRPDDATTPTNTPTPVVVTPVIGTPIVADPAAPAAPPIAPGLPGNSPFITH